MRDIRVDRKIDDFLGNIEQHTEKEMDFLKRVRKYCSENANLHTNASYVGYFLTMGDIIDGLITIRSMKTGEE